MIATLHLSLPGLVFEWGEGKGAMEHLRQRPLERRERAQDQFDEYVSDLLGNEIGATVESLSSDSNPVSESSPPPSPIPDTSYASRIPTVTDPAPELPNCFPSAPSSVGSVRNARTTVGTIEHISTPGWIMILSGTTLVSIVIIVAVMSLMISYHRTRKRTHYVDADEAELLESINDEEKKYEIPTTILISHRVAPECYDKLDDDDEYNHDASSNNAPTVIHFRTPNQLRGFVKLESERMAPIPEERSLGDLSTLCNEDYIFEDHTE